MSKLKTIVFTALMTAPLDQAALAKGGGRAESKHQKITNNEMEKKNAQSHNN